MELTCCIAAPMEMCFGFVIKTVLVTATLWLQLGRAKDCFSIPTHQAGSGQKARRGARDIGPQLTKGTPQIYILEFNQVHRNSTNFDIFMVFKESFIRDHLGSNNKINM